MSKRKLKRIEKNIENAKKSNGKQSKSSQMEQATQYSVAKSKQSVGIAKTNQGAINQINTELEDIWINVKQNRQRIEQFDTKMATYDEKEIEPLKQQVEVLIDLFLNLGIDPGLSKEQLKILGIEYEGDDNDSVENVESGPESDEDQGDDETEDD